MFAADPFASAPSNPWPGPRSPQFAESRSNYHSKPPPTMMKMKGEPHPATPMPSSKQHLQTPRDRDTAVKSTTAASLPLIEHSNACPRYALLRMKQSGEQLSQSQYDAVLAEVQDLLSRNPRAYSTAGLHELPPTLQNQLTAVFIQPLKKPISGFGGFHLPKRVQNLKPDRSFAVQLSSAAGAQLQEGSSQSQQTVFRSWRIDEPQFHQLTRQIAALLVKRFPKHFAYCDDFSKELSHIQPAPWWQQP